MPSPLSIRQSMIRSRQAARVSLPAYPAHVVRGKRQGRGLGILLRLLTLVMAQQAIPMVGSVAATGAMWKTTTAAVGILLASQAAQAQNAAPAKPTGLELVPRSGALILTWTDPSDASITKYQYWYNEGQALSGVPTADDQYWIDIPGSSATTTNYRLTGLKNDPVNTYRVRIRAVNANGASERSDKAQRKPSVDRTPGLIFSSSPNPLLIWEGSDRQIITSLRAQPVTGDVTITVTGAPVKGSETASDKFTLSKSSLTFTKDNYKSSQRIRVETKEDVDIATDTAVLTFTATGDDYGSLRIPPLTVKSVDDDGPLPKPDSLTAIPDNTKVTLIWTMPRGSAVGSWEYRQRSGTGGYGSWQAAASATSSHLPREVNISYTVSGLTNDTKYTFQVRAKNYTQGPGPASEEAMATPMTGTAGVTVYPTELMVVEVSTATYMVKLNAAPDNDVTVTPSIQDTKAVDFNTATPVLTFTTSNWDAFQSVVVLGREDGDTDNEMVSVSHAVVGYGSVMSADPVTVTVEDNDLPPRRVTVSPASLMINEGATSEYMVKLGTMPSGSVTVTPSSSDTGSVTVSSALTFTTTDWNVAQSVVVTAEEDRDGANENVVVSHAVSGADYGSVPADSVLVKVTDDDIRGVIVSPTEFSLTEGGDTGSYTVVLDTMPTGSVTVTPSSSDTGAATVSNALTFTTTDWDTAQSVVVTAVEDNDKNNEGVTVSHAISGADYGSVTVSDVMVTVTDKDRDSNKVPDKPKGFEVKAGNGALSLFWDNPFDTTISKYQYIYDSKNTVPSNEEAWIDIPDSSATTTSYKLTLLENDKFYFARVRAVNSNGNSEASDEKFNKPAARVATREQVLIDPLDRTVLRVPEGTIEKTWLTLSHRPIDDVIVTVTGASGDVGVNPSSFTFTKGNWSSRQTLTVTVVPDLDAEPDIVTLSFRAMGSGYDSVRIPSLTVKSIENQGAPEPPVLRSAIAGDAKVTIEWAHPKIKFTSYSWQYRQKDGTKNYSEWMNIDSSVYNANVGVGDSRTYTISGLANNTEYTFQVRGKNTKGFGEESNEVMATPMAATPGVTFSPTDLRIRESGEDYYVVKLNAKPTGDVTVTPTSSDTNLVVDPSALTFTADNWETLQMVKVYSSQDLDTTDNTVRVTHAVSGAADYSSVTASRVTVTVEDNDLPPRSVTVTPTMLPLTEGGSNSGTYTVVLSSEPTGDVMVEPSSGDTAAVTVSVATNNALTFTASNWATAQTVTVMAADDLDAANEEDIMVRNAVSGADYDSLTAEDVTVTVTDDDEAGVTVDTDSDTEGSQTALMLDEGATAEYTVVLSSEPTGDVMVTPSSGNAAITVSAALTFTAGNWNTAQTVMVTAVEDDDAEDPASAFTVSHAVSGADYASGVTAASVTVTVEDDDERGITIDDTDPDTDGDQTAITVAEGSSVTYKVKLSTEPSGDVMVTPSSSDTTAVTVSVSSGNDLTFTTANWNTFQPVTVMAEHDDDATNPASAFTVSHSFAGADYAGVTAKDDVMVTVTDDDEQGVTFVPADRMVTVEEGSSSTYTVKLDTLPTGDVTVTPSSDNTAVTLSAALTFTASNWDTAQTVTVMAEHDDDADDEEDIMVSHAVSGAASDYATGVTAEDVEVMVNDDDSYGLTIAPDNNMLTINEGDSDTYTVKLSAKPDADVRVIPTISSNSVRIEVAVGSQLTFTATNWNTAQTVTVTAVDNDSTGANADDVTVDNIVIGSGNYAGIDTVDVTVQIVDDDEAGVQFNPASRMLAVAEGNRGTYGVKLTKAPTDGNVMVTPTSADAEAVAVVSAALTFTPTNWSREQLVTVMAVADDDGNDESVMLTHAVSGTGNYAGVTAEAVTVTVDDSSEPGVTVSSLSPARLTEGSSGTYTVVLNTIPTGDVMLTPSSSDAGAVTLSVATGDALTFTTSNWNTAQPVTVTAVADDDTNDESVTVSNAVSGADYAGVEAEAVTVEVDDADEPGVTVSADNGRIIVNEGSSSTYTVKLDTRPSDNVRVIPTSEDRAAVMVSAELTFTSSNWNTAQTVTLTSVDNDDVGANDDVTVSNTVIGFADYEDIEAEDVMVSINDNDGAGVTITPASRQVTVEEGASGSYTVKLNTQPDGDVVVSPRTTSEAVGLPALTFTTTNWGTAQAVTVLTRDNEKVEGDRVLTIAHVVTGYGDVTSAGDVSMTITDNDNSPVLAMIEDQRVVVNEQLSITATATDADGDTITYTWSRKEGETMPALPDGTALNEAELSFTPTVAGTYTMMVTASDGNGNSDEQEVLITVTGGPTISITDVSEAEGGRFSFTVSASEAPSQDVTFQYTVTAARGDTAIAGTDFTAVSPAMTGTIAAGEESTTIEVEVIDDDLDEDDETFTVSLSNPSGGFAIADATARGTITDDDNSPVLTTIPPQTGAVGTMFSVTATATDADGDTITYAWSRKDGETIPALPDGTALNEAMLSFTPTAIGTYTMMVTASDPHGNSSEPQEVAITVSARPERSLSIADVSEAEGGRFSFTVMASPPPSQDVTFQYTVTAARGDTAIAGTDFTAVSPAMTGTIAAGARSTTIEVEVTDDDLDEGDETFTVSLSNPSGGFAIPDPTATGTITDDDNSPVLTTIPPQTAAVGTMFSVTATASDADGDTISYAWSRKDGETIPALPDGTALNEATLRFTPTAIGTYTMMVTASDPHGNSSEPQEVSITVSARPERSLGIADVSEAEGGRFSFTVSASEAASEDVTFQYTVTAARGDTATANTDFTAVSTPMTGTIAAGERSTTIEVEVTDDDLVEGDETFTVSLSNPSGGFAIPDPTAMVTITDDDHAPVLTTIAPQTAAVGVMFSVTATATDEDDATISYRWSRKEGELTPALPDGTALNEAMLSFTPTAIGTYTMMVTASDPHGNSSEPQEVSITVSARPERSLGIADVSEAEDGRFSFTVMASPPPSQDVTFQYTVTAARGDTATANTDFTAVSPAMTGTIAARERSTTIEVEVTDDDLVEGDETFTVSLSNPSGGFTITDPTATGTITDDDHAPVLTTIAPQTAAVGVMFSVTATATDEDDVTISYRWSRKAGEVTPALPDGTALNEAMLSFRPTAIGTYTMMVTASDPHGNSSEPQEVSITVSARPATVSVPNTLSVREGTDENATVTITTTRAFGQEVTFNVSYRGTAVGAAEPSGMDDYDNDAVTSVTFGASDTRKDIVIPLYDDSEEEDDKTILVTIAPAAALPDGFSLTNATTTVTISDDDDPSLSITAPAAVTEGDSGSTDMVFTVTLSPASGQQVTVDYGVDASSTATADTDFTDLSGTLTFAAGETSKPITVAVTGDAADEPDETVVLKLSNASNASIATATATGTITDDDEPEVHKEKPAQAAARKEELAGLSRATLSIATDMIGARIGGELSGAGGSAGEQALGVMENLLGFSQGSELSTNLSLEQLGEQLWSESFHISQSDSGSAQQDRDVTGEQQGHWSLWGAGELRSYNGNDDSEANDLSYSGSMRAGWLGADYQFSNSWLAGLALSFSSAESNYNYRLGSDASDAGSGKTETQLTTFYPYGSFQLTERLMLWGTVGIGFGDLQHQSDGATDEQDGELKVQLAAIGFEQKLSSLAAWQFSLAGDLGIVKSSTEWQDNVGLEDQSISITRARLGVNSSFPFTENTTAYLNLKGRLDGGDLQMGAAEVLLGLRYRTGRFSALLQGRQTYAFDGTYSESGILAELRLSSQQDGTGLAVELQPSFGAYGELASTQAALWDEQQFHDLINPTGNTRAGAMALNTNIGYGIRLPETNLLLTPFAEVAFRQGRRQQIGLGLIMEAPSWELKLSASTEDNSSTAPNATVKLMFSKQL